MTIHERTATRAVLPDLPALDTRQIELRRDEYGSEYDVEIERHDAFPITYRDSLVERVSALLPSASAVTLDAAVDTLAALLSGDVESLDAFAERLYMLGIRTVDVLDALDRLRFDPLDDDGSAAPTPRATRRRVDGQRRSTRRVVGSSAPHNAPQTERDAAIMSETVETLDELTAWYYGASVEPKLGTDTHSWESVSECADPIRLRERMGASIAGDWDIRKRRAWRSTTVASRSHAILPKPRRTTNRALVEQDVERDEIRFLASRFEILAPGPVEYRDGRRVETTRRVVLTFAHDGNRWTSSDAAKPAKRRAVGGTRRARTAPVVVESLAALDVDAALDERRADTGRTALVRLGDAIRTTGAPTPTRSVRVVEQGSDELIRGAWTDGLVTVSVVDLPKADRWRMTLTIRNNEGETVRRFTRSNIRRGGINRAIAHHLARG